MLLAEQPGHAMTYRIYAGLIRNPESGRLWDEILLMPLRIRVLGLWGYRCVFGGASWTMFVSAHKSTPMDALSLRKGVFR